MVEIKGVTRAAWFPDLDTAIPALWDSVRALPIGPEQYETFLSFFGPGARERVEETLARDGLLVLPFTLAGCDHTAQIRPSTASERGR